jgi:pimeloyl-ACP methyl ester carboxylesterase
MTMASLHAEVEGREGQGALLLLHGILSSNLQWAPNRDALSAHFRLVAVELWGHGTSPAPRDPACYRVDRYVAELEGIRRKLGVDRWLVCGQSFGAGIAIRYALAQPRAVRGLVFTNSRSALNDVSREAGESFGLEAWEALDARTLPFHPCHARRFPANLKAQMETAADAIEAYPLWQAATTTARDLCCRDVAARLRVPTLIVNGRYEKSFQPDRAFALATIPGLEVVDLDAGHSVNIEAAAGFDAAVIDFAGRHP